MMKITAYADQVSVAPGETINFMVNCAAKSFKADIVKLICGDLNPDGPGYKEIVIRTPASGTYKGRKQVIHAGSFVKVENAAAINQLQSFTLQAMIWPTIPAKGRQTVISNWSHSKQCGAQLIIEADNGGVGLCLGAGKGKIQTVATGKPLLVHEWYFVAASFDAKTKTIRLIQEPLHTHVGCGDQARQKHLAKFAKLPMHSDPVTLGAQFVRHDKGRSVCQHHYNGKIDSPRIASRALDLGEMEALKRNAVPNDLVRDVVAAWDFSADIIATRVRDMTQNRLHGEIVNLPVRGMTGWHWDGEEMSWKHAPGQYGAIHFHDDDIYDAGWEVDFSLTVPKDLKSGLYAARLRCGDDDESEDYVPFAILPPRGAVTAKICFLLPTGSYMAYANEHMAVDVPIAQLLSGRLVEHDRQDLYRHEPSRVWRELL